MKENDCTFCRIARKEISARIVYEDKEVVAFLDAFPCVRGQILVIPKKHADYFVDMGNKDFNKIMTAVKKVSLAVQSTLKPVKVGVIIEGLEVNHVHVKLYPLTKGGFEEIVRCRPEISEDEMGEIAEKIKGALG